MITIQARLGEEPLPMMLDALDLSYRDFLNLAIDRSGSKYQCIKRLDKEAQWLITELKL